jgi:hypothetical protein
MCLTFNTGDVYPIIEPTRAFRTARQLTIMLSYTPLKITRDPDITEILIGIRLDKITMVHLVLVTFFGNKKVFVYFVIFDTQKT